MPPGKSDEAGRVQMGRIIQWFSCELHAWPACSIEVPSLSAVLLKLSTGVSLLPAVHLCGTVPSSHSSAAINDWQLLDFCVSLTVVVLLAHHCFSEEEDVCDPKCPSKTSSCHFMSLKTIKQYYFLLNHMIKCHINSGSFFFNLFHNLEFVHNNKSMLNYTC